MASGRTDWASWFLQVADEEGQFLRLPIAYPALEIVAPDGQELHAEEPGLEPIRPATTVAARQGAASRGRLADFIRQISARRQRTTQCSKTIDSCDTSFHLYVSSAKVYGFVPAAWSRLPALPVRQRMTLKLAASQTTRPNVLTRIWSFCRTGDTVSLPSL